MIRTAKSTKRSLKSYFLPWTLDIPCWILDIPSSFFRPSFFHRAFDATKLAPCTMYSQTRRDLVLGCDSPLNPSSAALSPLECGGVFGVLSSGTETW